MSRRFVALASVLALVACAPAYPTAPQTTPSPISTGVPTTRPGTTQPPTPFPGGPEAEIELDLGNGPHTGSYRAVRPGACQNRPAHNTFTVTYADDIAVDGLVALNLVLRDAATAQADESSDFLVEISIGSAGAGVTYLLDPASGAGDGSAFLDVSPVDATLDLTGQTSDGTEVELFVTCGQF